MEWTKLKNIILIILVALNLALALLIGGPELTNYYRHAQANEEAVAFLAQKGISLSEEIIPNTEDLLPQVVERDREEEERLARQLLGEESYQEDQGGEVSRYISPAGIVQFHSDGSFWAQLEEMYFPAGNAPEDSALSVLEKLGFEGEVVARGENNLTVRQSWSGASLFNQQATVVWNQTGVTEITAGRRLYGAPEADPTRQTITRSTALVDFYNGLNQLGDVCSRIDAIAPGYVSATSLSRLMTLTPVWRVTTDTGTYQLDLVSGGLERVA